MVNEKVMVKAWINDIPVEVPEDTTILDAAKTVQCEIPTLCNHRTSNRPLRAEFVWSRSKVWQKCLGHAARRLKKVWK